MNHQNFFRNIGASQARAPPVGPPAGRIAAFVLARASDLRTPSAHPHAAHFVCSYVLGPSLVPSL